MNRMESRYFDTAQRMDKAFLSLLEEKDFAYITVKEICTRAGVNRSTFYLHYETIADLLAESVEYIHRLFLSSFPDVRDFGLRIRDCPMQELYLLTPEYLCPYFMFIREHRRLYHTVMENAALFSVERDYGVMFEEVFAPILARFSVPEDERRYVMAFYIRGLSAIVEAWLREDCADSIEHVMGIVQRCVMQEQSLCAWGCGEEPDARK